MSDEHFGIDPQKETYTAEEVRDAIIACFERTHGEVIKESFGDLQGEEAVHGAVVQIMKKAFSEVEGNFEKPTKESLLQVMDYLREFSKQFRDIAIIEDNYQKIHACIDKIA